MDVKDDGRLDKNSCPPVNVCLNLSKICFVSFYNEDRENIGRGEWNMLNNFVVVKSFYRPCYDSTEVAWITAGDDKLLWCRLFG